MVMSKLVIILQSLIIFCTITVGSETKVYAQNNEISYQGFRVDFLQIRDSPQKDAVIKAVKRQIDIVEQVRFSEENLSFFKSVPIVLIPPDSGTPGVYGSIRKTVFLKAQDLAPNRPILLHELLHAYHHLKIADGFQNAEIRAFYEEAKKKYPGFENEYFLSNAKEFFAVTASIYLFGNIPRPPSNRAAIKKAQPNYYTYLDTLFGQRD